MRILVKKAVRRKRGRCRRSRLKMSGGEEVDKIWNEDWGEGWLVVLRVSRSDMRK